MKPQVLAAQWAKLFQTKTRNDGTSFVSIAEECRDTHPLHVAVRDAHSGRMPDDHVWSTCEDACLALADANDIDDVRLEADPYYANILAWLASNLANIDYIDQAITEYGARDGHSVLTYAHDAFRNDILASIRDSLVKEAEPLA